MIRSLIILAMIVFLMTMVAMLVMSWRMAERHHMGAQIGAALDAAIVLGEAHAIDDVLSLSSRQRVAVGVALLRQGKVGHLIMTGGPQHDRPPSHAEVMRRHAIALGAAPDAVTAEGRARTTLENFRFSFAIMRAQGFATYALVTDSYHMTRSIALAEFLGWPPEGVATARSLEYVPIGMRVHTALRETSAWWYNVYKVVTLWVFDRFDLPDAWRDRLVV